MNGQDMAGVVTRRDVARWASRLAVAGAAVQIGYGMLACVFRYPTISDRPFEALWAIANVGMIANIVTWLLIGVARPRAGLVGGGLAILGHLVRVAISVVILARPDASVDGPIVLSITLMFAGLAVLGVATLRAGRLGGWSAWAPLLVLAGGLVAAPFYSFDKVVHFILLGLLWGTTWLFMAWVGHRQVTGQRRAEAKAPLATTAP
jgi:hypothetical protein